MPRQYWLSKKLIHWFISFVDWYIRNPSHVKAVFCKSEALYNMCNFEYALLGYLKGSRLAPDWECFKLGHIKCKKTINNSLAPGTFRISGLEGELLVAFLNTFKMETLYEHVKTDKSM